jgi:hypothetical protein
MSCLKSGCGKRCSHRRARDDCAYEIEDLRREGLVVDGAPVPGSEEERGAVMVTLRRFPNIGSSRGGVLMGERRTKDARCGVRPSSSKARPVLWRFAGELIGTGALEELWATVGLDAAGFRGTVDAVAEFDDAEPGLEEADADTEVVCGSLGVLRNGLNSHDGASLEATEIREEPFSLRSFLDKDERVDRAEWMDD